MLSIFLLHYYFDVFVPWTDENFGGIRGVADEDSRELRLPTVSVPRTRCTPSPLHAEPHVFIPAWRTFQAHLERELIARPKKLVSVWRSSGSLLSSAGAVGEPVSGERLGDRAEHLRLSGVVVLCSVSTIEHKEDFGVVGVVQRMIRFLCV